MAVSTPPPSQKDRLTTLGLEPVAVRDALLPDRSSWRSIPFKKMRRAVTAPRPLCRNG
jgi:hypothetical protein